MLKLKNRTGENKEGKTKSEKKKESFQQIQTQGKKTREGSRDVLQETLCLRITRIGK